VDFYCDVLVSLRDPAKLFFRSPPWYIKEGIPAPPGTIAVFVEPLPRDSSCRTWFPPKRSLLIRDVPGKMMLFTAVGYLVRREAFPPSVLVCGLSSTSP